MYANNLHGPETAFQMPYAKSISMIIYSYITQTFQIACLRNTNVNLKD